MTRYLSDRGFLASRGLSYTFPGTTTTLDAAFPITHNLGAVPSALELWVEQSAGVWEKHDPSTYVQASSTQLISTGTTLASVLGAGTNVRLVATTGGVAVNVQEATDTVPGIVSTTTQAFAGDKTFLGALTLGPPVVGGVNGVAHLVRTGDQGATISISTSNTGTIQIANAAPTAAAPSIFGISNDTGNAHGLFIGAATNDANTGGDMCFDVRESDNTDFATTTSTAFVWRRFGNVLGSITRAGEWTLGSGGFTGTHIINGSVRQGVSCQKVFSTNNGTDITFTISGLPALVGTVNRICLVKIEYAGIDGDATNLTTYFSWYRLTGVSAYNTLTLASNLIGTPTLNLNSSTNTGATLTLVVPSTNRGALIVTIFSADSPGATVV